MKVRKIIEELCTLGQDHEIDVIGPDGRFAYTLYVKKGEGGVQINVPHTLQDPREKVSEGS